MNICILCSVIGPSTQDHTRAACSGVVDIEREMDINTYIERYSCTPIYTYSISPYTNGSFGSALQYLRFTKLIT